MQKVLVVGPAWVGDMVMAQSLYRSLKQVSLNIEIDVLAPAWSAPILKRMPEIRRYIDMPVGHGRFGLADRYRLGKALRGEGYDQAVIIPRSLKAALVPFFARIPRRTGYKGEMRFGLINDMRPLDKSVLTQTVQRYVALGLEPDAKLPPADFPLPQLDVDSSNQQVLQETLSLSLDRPVVGFVPGAEYGLAKRWPPEYFAELAQRLIEDGKQVWLFGSGKDQAVCKEITDQASGVIDLSGKTALEDVVDLIALTEQVVTNDSGLMHIAAATGRRVVAIYGSSSPDYTPPLTDQAEVVYLNLECSPCFKRQCPLGHTDCLRNISVDAVYKYCRGVMCQQ